jgi:hypothetical protein
MRLVRALCRNQPGGRHAKSYEYAITSLIAIARCTCTNTMTHSKSVSFIFCDEV